MKKEKKNGERRKEGAKRLYLIHPHPLKPISAQRAHLRAGREEVMFEASDEAGDIEEGQVGPAG